MTRSLTTAVKTELATNDIRPIHLITIGFGTTVNITDCSFPLTSSVSGASVTYDASDFIMNVPEFSEQTELSKSTLTLALSGADQTFISVVLNENVINDSVDIYRGFLNDSNSLIADPFLFYKGIGNKNKYPDLDSTQQDESLVYPFNAMEQFSHVRAQLKFYF